MYRPSQARQRRALIDQCVAFLSNKSVRRVPQQQEAAFLSKKNMADEDKCASAAPRAQTLEFRQAAHVHGTLKYDGTRSASTRTASDALLRFKLVTIPFIAEVKFLPKLMPRACHRKQLRLVCRRICNLSKPKVVLSLSTKPIRHGNLPIRDRNARAAGLFHGRLGLSMDQLSPGAVSSPR